MTTPMTAMRAVSPMGEPAQRIDALLATVKDITSSLTTAHAALENEMVLTMGGRNADPGAAAAGGKSVLTQLVLENAQLREALASRAVIEQAKGILMGRHGCDPDQAFELLGAMSRRQRRKIRQIATWMIEQATTSDPSDGVGSGPTRDGISAPQVS